jgi:hypothetical protein
LHHDNTSTHIAQITRENGNLKLFIRAEIFGSTYA